MQNFNSPAFTQTDLDKFLTIFQVKNRFFSLENFKNFRLCKKFRIELSKKQLLPKFGTSTFFPKISKLILNFFTPEFALDF
jgi:hypothetical protein